MANSLPHLSGFGFSFTFGEDVVNLAPQVIDAEVSFTDDDIAGGTLVLSGGLAEDILAIRNEGTGSGQIGVDGDDISYGGVVIGSFSGGTGGTALAISFNAQANSAAVETLIENLTFQNLSDTPMFARTLELNITDADGGSAVGPVLMHPLAGTLNPLSGVTVSYSAPAFADLDGDGDLDAAVGNGDGTVSYYKNTGTAAAPVYVEQTGTANPFNGIDIGSTSKPAFADVNLDGRLDLVLNGGRYFLNQSTGTMPVFSASFSFLSGSGFSGLSGGDAVAVGDLDADGDLDVVGGSSDGTLRYWENQNGGAFDDGWLNGGDLIARTGAANPFNGLDVGTDAMPSVGDLDRDGDLDVLVGAGGTFHYFENTGTDAAPAFVERTGADNPFGGFQFGAFLGFGLAAPAFADLDGDGDLDVLSGSGFYGTAFLRNESPGDGRALYIEKTGPFTGVNLTANNFYGRAALCDLDGDGDFDLVEGGQNGLLFYLENTGSAAVATFVQRAGAANPFNGLDVGSFSAPALADLDGDGDRDAVVGEQNGTLLYFENTGSAAAATFVQRTGAANPFNGLDVGSHSAPAFGDLDGDGDPDAVIGVQNGTLLYFENTGSAAAAAFVQRTGAANPFNGIDIGDLATPSLADVDGDRDLDLVSGDGLGTFSYLENTGTAAAAAYVQRTGAANPFDGVDVDRSSAPSLADLDGDGDVDAVSGTSFTGVLTGTGATRYLENVGSQAAPRHEVGFVERTGAANPLNGKDVGSYSAPFFADVDGDGDFDLVSAKYGSGILSYFENTGSGAAPAYVERTGLANPFDGVAVIGNFSEGGSLADLDGDGDLDLAVGGFYGLYFENTGTVTAPVFVARAGEDNPFNYGLYGKPALADLDGDGDLDAVVGKDDGTLSYLKNIGTAAAPELFDVASDPFTLGPNPFKGIDVGNYASPTLVDLDGDGDIDAVVGDLGNPARLRYFENDGTRTTPHYVERTGATNPFNGIDVGFTDATPAFADLNGDGDLDLVLGKYDGGFRYFENPGDPSGFRFVVNVVPSPSEGDDVIYDTPGNDTLEGLGGNDTLLGHGGNDALDGGAGNDWLDGGADTDTASYASATAGVTVSLATQGVGQNTSGAGNDTLTGFENVTGSNANDALTGDAGANRLEGGAGLDSLAGGSGDDVLIASATGTAGSSRIVFVQDVVVENFGEGEDTVYSNSSFVLPDEVENLVMTGAPMWRAYAGTGNELDNNITTQGAARHRLSGEGGNDTLDGGAGNDQLRGGSGDDVLIWDVADALLDGGAGADTLRIGGSGVTLDLTLLVPGKLSGIEAIDLGAGNNLLVLDAQEVLDLSDTSNTLRVDVDVSGAVNMIDFPSWNSIGGENIGGVIYQRYEQGLAVLLLHPDIST